jgi:hypothetical protein
MKTTANIMDCPGAWYGCQPAADSGNVGHVVIDPKHVEEALRWFRKFYFYSVEDVTTDKGLFFRLTLKKPSVSVPNK